MIQEVVDNRENYQNKRRSRMQDDLSMSTISDMSSTNDNENEVGYKQEPMHPDISPSYMRPTGGGDYKNQIPGRGQEAGFSDQYSRKSPISSPTSPFSIGGDEFALVVNGHSLVYALTPDLEQLFLSVAENCACKYIHKAFSILHQRSI